MFEDDGFKIHSNSYFFVKPEKPQIREYKDLEVVRHLTVWNYFCSLMLPGDTFSRWLQGLRRPVVGPHRFHAVSLGEGRPVTFLWARQRRGTPHATARTPTGRTSV